MQIRRAGSSCPVGRVPARSCRDGRSGRCQAGQDRTQHRSPDRSRHSAAGGRRRRGPGSERQPGGRSTASTSCRFNIRAVRPGSSRARPPNSSSANTVACANDVKPLRTLRAISRIDLHGRGAGRQADLQVWLRSGGDRATWKRHRAPTRSSNRTGRTFTRRHPTRDRSVCDTFRLNGSDTFWPIFADWYAAYNISSTARPSSPEVIGAVSVAHARDEVLQLLRIALVERFLEIRERPALGRCRPSPSRSRSRARCRSAPSCP